MIAIPTEHRGLKLRSRLEARWCTFFDEAGIKYCYEPQVHDLGSGIWYLPDFYLPQFDSFIEIKPKPPTEEEAEKCSRLSCQTWKTVYCFIGFPDDSDQNGAHVFYPNETCDYNHFFCECECGKIEISFEGNPAHQCLPSFWSKRKLEAAMRAAKERKFKDGR
jgi:hypothetical protein